MEQSPSPYDRIEGRNESFLGSRLEGPDNVPGFVQKGLRVLSCRGYQKLLPTPILSEMLAQEIEPFRDVCDGGLLFREFETPFMKKGFHHRPDFIFEELFRVSCNHKVVGESDHVDTAVGKPGFQFLFQTVQGHVAERRGDDPALGGSRMGPKEASTVDDP